MAFFRKAGNILSRTVSNHVSQEISTSQPSIFQAIRCMSTSKLFIGGLSYSTDDSGLREAFSKYGEVADARVIVDRDTGRSRGFGFVTFSTVEDASAAIQALDQQDLHGRRVRVAYANERTRGYGGGGGFGSGGYGGNYGNGGGFGGNYGGGGGGGYGGNYGSGGGGYGGNYGSGGGYGGNFGSGGSGGAGYGGNFDNAASGEDGHTAGGNLSYGGDGQNFGGAVGGSGGSYASNTSYGGGNLPGSDGQNSGVAGGGGGSDNFFTDNNVGTDSNFVSSEVGQFKIDAEESKSSEGATDSYSQDEPVEGNYRDDDDTPNDYADRRS
ncbi:glycine-rich RNA-binding 2, mitochondrial-like [Olea europaea subsp. europaea]|uniref:Glycine-rich RNA-binding 2, mitochondrial-like n=1 Tax=Olea europaea subsp. europaea TaxID=158383 RepID=A0A8S0SPL7_OLEEU|nr:glycine-rich RNA-binding 2, mitochondrial-like [Olea europaea subsp. europaea]